MYDVKVVAGDFAPRPNATTLVMEGFARDGGQVMVDHVRKVLGTAELGLQLSPQYSKRKQGMKQFKRYGGKLADQPGILSGSLYEAVTARLEGDAVIVQVDSSAGVSPEGFDYAEALEERADYIGIGFEALEEPLAELLLEIAGDVLSL